MRNVTTAVFVAAMCAAAPLVAQERGHEGSWQDAGGYVTGMGGFTTATGNTTGDVVFEAGVRVAPHVMVFGDVGQFRNLQSDLQPTLASATTSLATTQGLTVNGGGTLPATYGLGGVRLEIPVSPIFLPYVLGGAGVARLNLTPQLLYASGVMPDGSTPSVGQDVTASLTTAGLYTAPSSTTAFMFTTGGGAQVQVASRWIADVGYRYSRIAADTTLSASPIGSNGMTFGIGYRF